ncbi:prenyltransferase/squalene oxidase repeat-containing protein [Frigoriglobus tundricola]|uniref:prenyltransferase/squalene oxidase repeat-containing protein n=1 Tax=Frigoriglobus tundricola TaxID=2774151 RepID=UPI00148EDE06|nr:prenyltransferase/squalene oxidase repeat-containing protein [Frigoriglobus tundricola]
MAFVFLLPSVSCAQTEEMIRSVEQKLATLKWIQSQEAPEGGFYAAPQNPNSKPAPVASLRATSAAARAWKYLGGEGLGSKFPNKEKHAAFVLKCYDPKTGGFAEPDGKPDVAVTSVGVMAAMELGVPKEKFAKAMDYLKANAKTFEEVRIAAAGVEAWGVKDCPFKLDDWVKVATDYAARPNPKDDPARVAGSATAFFLRLDRKLPDDLSLASLTLRSGQRKDGGWGKVEGDSDIETTYRVMRALMLLRVKPKDPQKLHEYLDAHRTKDAGYSTKPGDPSSMSGVYYYAIVSKWLDDMEEKK